MGGCNCKYATVFVLRVRRLLGYADHDGISRSAVAALISYFASCSFWPSVRSEDPLGHQARIKRKTRRQQRSKAHKSLTEAEDIKHPMLTSFAT